MKTVLNKNATDIMSQPMFLGESLGLQRYDIVKYPEFKKSYEDQRGQYWQAQEIPVSGDRAQYQELGEVEKHVFVNNLQFQTMGDSCLSRTISQLLNHVSNTELEYAMNWWSLIENLHSESYTWVLQNIVPEPSTFFDNIYENKAVMARADQLTASFDHLLAPTKDIREDLFKTVLGLQVAEGILFYVSFACSFWFGARGVMKGNADIIRLIARDEDLHVAITQNIMNRWRTDPKEGFQEVFTSNEELIYETYRMAAQNEKNWASHLFSKGSLMGLNEKILHGYVEWLSNTRLKSMGLKPIFETKKSPVGGWIREYIRGDETAPAPQEKSLTDYEKGKLRNDLADADFGDLLD